MNDEHMKQPGYAEQVLSATRAEVERLKAGIEAETRRHCALCAEGPLSYRAPPPADPDVARTLAPRPWLHKVCGGLATVHCNAPGLRTLVDP